MSEPLPVNASFADLVIHHALTQPEKPAIVLADRVVTYDIFAQGMLRVERRLRALALQPGALLCITLDSPIRHMIVAAALFRLGHPVMSATRASDIVQLNLPVAAFLENAGAAVIPGQRHIIVEDAWFEGDRLPVSPGPRGFPDDRAICRVEMSSGTTGRPKAVSLTLAAVNKWIANYYHSAGQAHWDRMMCLPGLTNSWGFTLAAHALHAGKTLLFADSARGTLQMIALYGVDMLVASSQQLRDIVREQTDAPIPCPTLRAVLTGGSLVSQTLMREAQARVCTQIISQYGSTEAGATAFATVDRLIGIEGATGFIAPWAVVEAVDDNDHVLPPATEGILRIRATCQGAPYPPDRPDAPSNFRDGWFYPGDRGSVREDGLLIVTGRTSELINAGGVKIAPDVIDDVVRTHPAIIEAAAFGALDAGGVEAIMLAIVPRTQPNIPQLMAWCAARNIPVARIFAVETLPKSVLGKINREQLRKQLLG